MDCLPPLALQLIVASSPQLAALSIGGLTGYPAVLLNQLKNDTSIILDSDSSSWVASIHGLAGIPSVLIPTLMQWKGRRLAFIAACLSTFIGWLLLYSATDVTTILVGESFHGFGGNSLIAVSLITISEMVDPRFRSSSMLMFGINQILGLVVVTFAGYFLHWRIVSLVMAVPTLMSLLLVFIWPESPSWLACKGEFKKCETAFILLRGTGREATKELTELIRAQKESIRQYSLQKSLTESTIKDVWLTLLRRDFLLPMSYVVLIMFTFYFSGPLVIFTYTVDIVSSITNNSDLICFIYLDVVIISGSFLGIILIKHYKNKTILIISFLGSAIFLILGSITIYLKEYDLMPKQGLLICVLGYMFCCMYGSCHLTFNMSTELIPVKHRGLGGALYIIVSCLFHSGSLKISPYLFESIDISGTFLFYTVVIFLGALLIWTFVPETKGKTLQEIEDYYNYKNLNESHDSKFEIILVNDDLLE